MMKVVLFLVCTGMLQAVDETPAEALRRLVAGNERYSEERLEHPNRGHEERLASAEGQIPFAAIVGCSDSRVSPEILFDQGIGDLFIVRVAGNVVGSVEMDSVDYAAVHLKASLVLVLGHQSCGAVQAVMQGKTEGIEAVADLMAPSISSSKSVEQAVKENVLYSVAEIKKSAGLKGLIEAGKLDVIGGYYNFQTGKVEILKPKLLGVSQEDRP